MPAFLAVFFTAFLTELLAEPEAGAAAFLVTLLGAAPFLATVFRIFLDPVFLTADLFATDLVATFPLAIGMLESVFKDISNSL